jgi:hypothetical protein
MRLGFQSQADENARCENCARSQVSAASNATRLKPGNPFGSTSWGKPRQVLQRGGTFWGEAQEHKLPWEPDSQSPQRSKLVAWVASPDRLWGNPNARSLCRETLIKDWLPPGTPVAYGGKPAPKLPQRGEPAQGTSLCSAGFTARRCSGQRTASPRPRCLTPAVAPQPTSFHNLL